MLIGASGEYLNRVVESSSNYWKNENVKFKDRHRPTSKFNINGIMRKNKFLVTKAVT